MDNTMEEKFTRADRDMLVITNSTVLDIKCDLKDLKDNITGRLLSLEKGKADDVDVENIIKTRTPAWLSFDTRIKVLENWKSVIVGTFAVISVVIALVVFIYFSEEKHILDSIYQIQTTLNKHLEQK
jgi:hypothetical protein